MSRVESKSRESIESKKSRVGKCHQKQQSQNIFNTIYNRSVTTADYSRTGEGGKQSRPPSQNKVMQIILNTYKFGQKLGEINLKRRQYMQYGI